LYSAPEAVFTVTASLKSCRLMMMMMMIEHRNHRKANVLAKHGQ